MGSDEFENYCDTANYKIHISTAEFFQIKVWIFTNFYYLCLLFKAKFYENI
jgi:hypothetical protein